MTATASPPQHRRDLPLRRSADDRVLAGVAAGLAARLGVDPIAVRASFVALMAAGGFGVLAYLAALAFSDVASGPARTAQNRSTDAVQRTSALGLVVVGWLLVLRDMGLWFGDALVWPVALASVGTTVLWSRSDEADRARWTRLTGRLPGRTAALVAATRISTTRVLVGLGLVAGGMVAFLGLNDALLAAGTVLLAICVTLVGALIVAGPWIARLTAQTRTERRERIRSEERAEMAAHLHDSVLHTLALIQKADASGEVVGLARAQERQLRAWLNGQDPQAVDLRAALEDTVGRIEREHAVRVDLVIVGDTALDERVRALVAATGEAVTNAARHAGTGKASVYVEVEADRICAYIRDEGDGFVPAAVSGDRRGIAESITGRMQRQGGNATIISEPGEGTEVVLSLPLPGTA